MPGIEPFHVRYHWLMIMMAIGGIYHPEMKNWFHSKSIFCLFKLYMGFTLLVSIFLSVTAFFHFSLKADNLYDGILDLMIFASSMLTAFRFIWYYTHKAEYLTMLEWWDDDKEAIEREALINKEMKYIKKFMAGATISAMVSLNLWAFSQFFDEDKIMKLPTLIPYKSQSPDFELTLSFHVFGCLSYNFGHYGLQFINLLPLIWILCELRRLKKSLQQNLESGGRTETELAAIDRRLNLWIHQHQKLISFHEASSIIEFSHSMEMMACFMSFWLIAFNWVQETVPFYDKISQVFFFMPYGFMFGITCYYADNVFDESKRIFDEAYASNWVDLPQKYRKSFVIIAQRSQHPFIMKGFNMFKTGNQTFFQILRSSYSVLNFLLASFRKKASERDHFL